MVPYPVHPLPPWPPNTQSSLQKGLPSSCRWQEVTNACFEPANQMVKCDPPPRQVHGLLPAVPWRRWYLRMSTPPSLPSRPSVPSSLWTGAPRASGRYQVHCWCPGGLAPGAACCVYAEQQAAIAGAWARLDPGIRPDVPKGVCPLVCGRGHGGEGEFSEPGRIWLPWRRIMRRWAWIVWRGGRGEGTRILAESFVSIPLNKECCGLIVSQISFSLGKTLWGWVPS